MLNVQRVLLVTAMLWCGAARAGGGGLGGATEVTQLLNHAELMTQVSHQATMVSQNVTAQVTRVQQLANQLRNLVQLPQQVLAQTLAPYQQQITDLKNLAQAVTDMKNAADQTRALFSTRMGEMSNLHMDPLQWLNAYITLAKTKGGQYQRQLDQDMNALDNLSQRAANLKAISDQIPQVSGNIEGLQLLNQQSNILAGEMVELRSLVQRQVALQTQDRLDQAQANARAAQDQLDRQAAAKQADADEKAAIQSFHFNVLKDQR